ncbi:J domain-containing protein [Flavobacterium sp.]|uniref:J domain-containing protein n=1 Tax=Flavobacterium sp. TaxID=239 RepID=UPI0012189BE2|nr:J domain-containing protein [Flavobacterium sp.]RZJ71481.1 MAG: J domain-containing protein [Flavobacterium sp.]
MKNHYETLKIKTDATQQEIKRSYRKLAVEFHPDKNNGDTFANDRFIAIQEAYHVLSNHQKKKIFDKLYLIHLCENEETLSPEKENVTIGQDYSTSLIILAALLVLVVAFFAIYYCVFKSI